MAMKKTLIEVRGIKKETEKSWVVWVDEAHTISLNISKKTSERLSDYMFRIPEWLYKKLPVVA